MRFQLQGKACQPQIGDEDQPVRVRLLAALLADAQDPDALGILGYAGGVRIGVGTRLPRTPAVFPRKRRWALPTQAHPELLDDYDFAEPVVLENYKSARELQREVEADLEDLRARGLCDRLTEEEAMTRFGSRFVVASLGGPWSNARPTRVRKSYVCWLTAPGMCRSMPPFVYEIKRFRPVRRTLSGFYGPRASGRRFPSVS